MSELEDILQHAGVKGMKWGVRRKDRSGSRKVKKPSRIARRIREEIKSSSRERSWNDVVKKSDTMTTKDIKKIASRVQMENSLKRLAKKSDIGSSKDRADYRKRANMSDQELARKVGRLQAKEFLSNSSKGATKSQREFGEKFVKSLKEINLAIDREQAKNSNKK